LIKLVYGYSNPKLTKVIHYSKPRAAELAKLFSNMYRYIDFAIGNEFMMIAEDHGCDIYEVLNLVNKDYKRGGLKSPGLTAGPCLVKDGFFLIDKSPYMELVTAAWRMNENVPGYLLSKIKRAYPDLHGKKVVILGMTFKKNIDDTRLSLAPKMARHFEAEGALVYTYDPYVAKGDLKKILKNADIVVLGVNHDEFKDITLSLLIDLSSDECLICDIWNLYGTGKLIYGKDLLAKKAKATLKQEDLAKLQSKGLVEKEKKSYSGLVS
jgi:UDP-N-acetyl-D-mannosaminuronic acid dehydrogenase